MYVLGCGKSSRAFARRAHFCSAASNGSDVHYKLFSRDLRKDWSTARGHCNDLAMDLLILTDENVQDLAMTLDLYG